MAELALDHDQRDPLAGHLDRMRVPQLMRREAAAHTGRAGGVMELTADPGGRIRVSACATALDTEERAGRQCCARLEPRLEVRLCPAVHSDFATFIAFAVADEHGAAVGVEVGVVERERLADPRPARQSMTITPRSLRPSGPSPAARTPR